MYKIMKIYYDKVNGEVIWSNSYNYNTIVSFDRDYEVVSDLNARSKDSIGLLVLENDAYA